MPVLFKQFAAGAALLTCLLVGLGCPGCRWLADGAARTLPDAVADASPKSVDADAPTEPEGATDDRSVLARHRDKQGHSVWIRAVKPAGEGDAEPRFRWHYPDLDEIVARPPQQRPDLHGYLTDKSPIVAGNAAIALARQGDAAGVGRLGETVRAPGIELPMRLAAVEALGGLAGPTSVELLRELIDQYGRPGPAYQTRLHAELLRGLASQVDPADERRFLESLRSKSADVRIEALRAWSAGKRGGLPDEIMKLSDDSDSRVREAAVLALARQQHPQAYERLRMGLHDYDSRVRAAAIVGLGELGGSQAEETLRRLLEDPSEGTRCEAVSALARLGSGQAIIEAAGDQSWRVRQRAAGALARFSDRGAAAAARQLIEDPSSEVQRELIAALQQWPIEQAGPVLLAALESESFVTRKSAADQLASRWPAAADFPLHATGPQRAEARQNLEGRFRSQFRLIDRAALSQALSGEQPVAALPTPEQLDQVERLVRQADVQGLIDFGPGLVRVLEQLVFDRKQVLPDAVYRQALPRLAPEFAAIDSLGGDNLAQRRRAAEELASMARQRPLSPLAVSRLCDVVGAEQDQLVWQSVLSAVRNDPHEPSIRLAYAAVSHPAAEVRRQACENLAACPDPAHARVLMPALDDESHSVACAAARALGSLGRIEDTGPLQRLLRSTNAEIRTETAVALARLGDPKGAAALERLSYEADPKVQSRAAQQMGELADPSFTPLLVRMLDGRPAVAHAAMTSLTQIVGRDVSTSGADLPPPTPERIRRWKQWFSQQAAVDRLPPNKKP